MSVAVRVGSGTGYVAGSRASIGLAGRCLLADLVRVEALGPFGSFIEADRRQVGAVQARLAEISAAEISGLEIGALEVGVVEVGVDESGAFELGSPKVACLHERPVELRALQPGAGKVGVLAEHTAQVAASQAGDPQVREGQVERS